MSAAVLVEVGNEKILGPWHFAVAVVCLIIVSLASFEYSEMLTQLKAQNINYSFWARAQTFAGALTVVFAILVKMTQKLREESGPRYPW